LQLVHWDFSFSTTTLFGRRALSRPWSWHSNQLGCSCALALYTNVTTWRTLRCKNLVSIGINSGTKNAWNMHCRNGEGGQGRESMALIKRVEYCLCHQGNLH
jgi:hypothetical protein